MDAPDHEIDWTKIQPDKRWSVFRKQYRFFLWALYSSIGCMMMGSFAPSTRSAKPDAAANIPSRDRF